MVNSNNSIISLIKQTYILENMNFQKIPPVESGKQLLDWAFQRARKKAEERGQLKGDWIKAIKQKESLKLDIIKDVLNTRLNKILADFPETIKLPTFYTQLLELTLDYPLFKKSFGAMKWATQKISFFQRMYVSKLNKERNPHKIGILSKEFYGRISSVIKQIDPNLKYLEESRRIMKTYPDVKDMFTICVYGFPNVGKSTLLNRLTGTKAEVAAYAFTTKTINAGYFKLGEETIQVMDVPGTLARPEKMNLIEMQAELVVKELAEIVIFVYDLSEQGGYSIEKQEELLQKLGKKKKVLIYVSKEDLTELQILANFRHKYYSIEELKKEIVAYKQGN